MTDTTVIISVMTLGFAFNFALMRMMWSAISLRFEKMEHKLDRMDEKLTDIDRRVCRIEGAMASKDCCMLKDEMNKNKAL